MAQEPTVIFLLMTYNQQAFVGEAIRAALAQDYEPLTIVISDDSSSDATFEIVQREVSGYSGPHKIVVYRTSTRLRSVDHLASLVPGVGGDFIVTAHGDDVSLPARTRRLVAAWQQQRVSLVSSNAIAIDEKGERSGFTCSHPHSRRIPAEEIIDNDWTWEQLGASLAFEPAVVTSFRPITSRWLAVGLDHVLPLRAAALDGFYYSAEPLLLYRRHATNMTHSIAGDPRSGDRSFYEIHLANEMAARMHALDDFALLGDKRPDDPELPKLQRRLAERLIRDLRWTARLRALLRADGFVPRWHRLEADPAASTVDAPADIAPGGSS